jgi:asparagine synthase (glutamine-hydrolysing)
MCGIGGILFSREEIGEVEARLGRMEAALAPRGPDGSGAYVDSSAALVHRRLALLDREGGRQPMQDPSGRHVLVYNGELYNHHDLRDQIGDRYPFRTASDAETLLAAFVVWGEACLDHLNGMFAFVVWDRALRRAFAARDPLGVKPLVYAERGGEVVFASDARTILAQRPAGARAVIDRRALHEYVLVPSLSGVRRSMFEGITHLGAGESLSIDERGITRRRWYHYRVGVERDRGAEEEGIVGSLRTALEASVSRAMIADVPVGVFLSGGLDSSSITALALRARSYPIRAFTIRFEDHQRIDYGRSTIVTSDDAPHVEALARAWPLELERVVSTRAAQIAALPALSADNDRVPAWEQELTQHFLARAASGRRKAVLVGDAADETHFGYFFLLRPGERRGPRGLMDLFGADLRERCLARDVREDLRPLETLEMEYREICASAGYGHESPAERARAMTHLVVTLWLGRLLHNGDAHTMAHGVEARVPFADREVLDVAQRVPPSWGYDAGVEKRLLREAMRPHLPSAIVSRTKSALPCDLRMGPRYQAALRPLLDEERPFLRTIFDEAALARLAALPDPSDNERALLFNVLALVHWKRCYLDGEPAPSAPR